MTEVHAVLPEGIDDAARPSGGNVYDRRVFGGLAALGWTVHEHPIAGAWPRPDAAGHAALARGSADGGALLCVAAVTRGKGHDVLLGGLATLPDLSTRERFTLWPAVAMTIVMGMFPMVFLKPMEPAVARLV